MTTRTLISRAATTAATLALVATGATAGASTAGASGSAGAPSAAKPCQDCQLVSKTDVDGDGAADRSYLQIHDDHDYTGQAELFVVLASGSTLRTVTDLPHLTTFDAHWIGAAKVDGEPGYELVLRADTGAHTSYARVVTYRDGALTTLKDPKSRYRWVTDGSVWSSEGYRASSSSTGKTRMTNYSAVSSNGGKSFTLKVKSTEWRNGRWAQLSSTTTRNVAPATAVKWGGWHVPYLPKGI